MKNAVLILMFTAFGLNAQAKPTQLVVPVNWKYQVEGQSDDIYLNAKQIRAELKKNGLEVPNFADNYVFDVSADADTNKILGESNRNQIEEVKTALTDAFKGVPDLEDGFTSNGYFPTGSDTKIAYTCYNGNPKELVNLFPEIADSLYTEQTTLLGWKFKQEKFVDGQSPEEAEPYLTKESKLWKNWRGRGEAALFLFSTGDDGTDVNEALIDPCK